MKLFLLTQEQVRGYDTYNSCVVCAKNEDKARLVRPSRTWEDSTPYPSWATNPSKVNVKYIGDAEPSMKEGVVLASFNAG